MNITLELPESALATLASLLADELARREAKAEEVITMTEAATRLGVTNKTARRYAYAGVLRRVPGGRTRVYWPPAHGRETQDDKTQDTRKKI